MARNWRTRTGVAAALALVMIAPVLRPALAASPPPRPPTAGAAPADAAPVVTLYSGVGADLAPLAAAASRDLGINLRILAEDDDLLLGRLLAEGRRGPADIVLLSGAVRLARAAAAGLIQPAGLAEVERAVPAPLRDGAGRWFAIASFARPILTATRIKSGSIKSYDDLADPAWSGRLCLPPAGRPGPLSLMAGMILRRDAVAAEDWARRLQANRAPVGAWPGDGAPSGIDLAQARALAEGDCDLAIVGSRSLAWIADPANQAQANWIPRPPPTGPGTDPAAADDGPLLDRLRPVWPAARQGGTQTDIIGAGLAGASDRRDAVLKMLGYLVSDSGQQLLARTLFAFPVVAGVPLTDALTRFGPFDASPAKPADILGQIETARAIGSRVGWP